MVHETRVLPKDWLAGLKENWKSDIVSGFILFLIALPLSLGIAMASGVPPLAGIIAAIVGGMFVSMVSGSHVVINGPAAGLIVVILAAVERLGGGIEGYHYALAAAFVAGLLMFVLGLCKAGELGHFFPTSVVHGMLAAIGFIIIIKEIPIMIGAKPAAKEPLMLVAKIPGMVMNLNPEIALIGVLSLILLILHTLSKNPIVKTVPAPIAVVVLAIALGAFFDVNHAHTYSFCSHPFPIDPQKCLVVIPNNPLEGIAHPDFGKIGTAAFWVSAISILLVQGIETLLSASAVADKLDPYRRPCNLSRDLSAVGLGSAISSLIGGLPMIAEIVRSTANVVNGAKTRWSNFFHGLFMLLFVILAAALIDRIPLSALAALLIVTGYKLSSPKVFKETHAIGGEQTIIFVTTIVATLATDLLIGVTIGIITKFLLHIYHGVPVSSLFKAPVTVEQKDAQYLVSVGDAAIFSNYISIKSKLDKIPKDKIITIDLSGTKLVDHTVMDRLHQYAEERKRAGGELVLVGLDDHQPRSTHPLSMRRRPATRASRPLDSQKSPLSK